MSIRSQVEAMNGALVEDQSGFAGPVIIDDNAGHVWTGSGVFFRVEDAVDKGVGMPVMELHDMVVVRIATVNAFFATFYPSTGGLPQQRWKITATDSTGAVVQGFANDVSPDLTVGRYSIRFGGK